MAAEFADFREDKCQIVPSGKHVWTRQDMSGIWFHIIFVIDPKRDAFTIEGAWDFDGKLPRFSYDGADGIYQQPVLFRVNFLWSRKDYWWLLVLRPEEYERALLYKDDSIEQCLPLIAPAVIDAAKRLKEHLIPVLEKVVQKHRKS